MTYHAGSCDVAVIGAGHAGIDAGLAAARLGLNTIVFTINLDAVGNLPCNPAIGGTGKGHLVRELDALGGEMGVAADKACIQYRMLNRGKGPAVHSLRAQADRRAYQQIMKHTLEMQEHLQLKQAQIVEVLTENGKVTGIVFKRCISVWDADGKFAPTYDENDTQTVPCDRVFLSIGQSIQWGDLLAGSKVQLGRGNGAVADSLTYQTAEPDIFVGGDVYTGPKFAIDAIAAGREGAISIHRFVQPHSSLTIGRNRREFIALDKDNIRVEEYDNGSRQIPGVRKDIDHKKSFRDAKLPFTEEQVKAETARCLGCGASVVDPNKCIGCGVCTTKCEFGAIKLHREHPECSTMIPSEKKLPYVLGNGAKQALKIKFSKKKEK